MRLTATSIKNAKPKRKLYRLADGHGLCLEVTPSGGKHWRFRYRFEGKASMIGLGPYPTVSLQEARARCAEARRTLDNGEDPTKVKRHERVAVKVQGETFEAVTREWFERFSPTWTPKGARDILSRLEANVLPWIGSRPIREITAPELLAVIRRIEARGAMETARRQLQKCGQIFRYAIAVGKAEHDPAAGLRGAIAPTPVKHFSSITDPKKVGALMRAIEGYEGSLVTRCALRLAPLVFVRPGELRQAEWSEIDLEAGEWRIPAEKMKMRQPHIVPLSKQAVTILREIQALTGEGRYVFPSERSRDRAMSNNTINAALRRLGYAKEEMTGHGFRSMASTLLNEQGWNKDAIERQLAHGERNKIRASYDFSEHLPERRRMMQRWADYLEALRTGAKVIPIRAQGGES